MSDKSTALDDLERWKHGKKSRAVSIERGNGYGADCWRVYLHGFDGKEKVTVAAAEVCFMGGEKESDFPRTTTFARPPWVSDDDDDTWPGLARTIHAAIDRADELGL